MIDAPSEKICKQCKKMVSIHDYFLATSNRDGYQIICKKCRGYNRSQKKTIKSGLTLRQRMKLGR